MKRAVAFFLGLLFFGASLGSSGDAGKDELKKLQGNWQFVTRILDGKKGDTKDAVWTISGNEITYGPNATVRAVFKLDATTKPKKFDFDDVAKDPTQGKKGIKGIYEIDGDTLKICVATKGERPKAFESKEGSGDVLTVLKRVKAEK